MRKFYSLLALVLLSACNLPIISPTPVESVTQANLPPTLTSTLTPNTVIQIPTSSIQIDGESYQAYQNPGDPFRFVCPAACPVDPNLIFAQYAGFHKAYAILMQLTGVDTLPELQPVDIHIKNDKKCGNLGEAPALSFAARTPGGNAYICTFLFEYAQGFNGQPYTPDVAIRLDQQTILVHEYFHTFFFGRITSQGGAFHDFVTPLALYIGDNWQGDAQMCAYHPETPPGDYGGYLIQQLCAQNGFQLKDLAPSIIALDKLYQSGGGQLQEGYQYPVPTMAQFRQILNHVLGSDTTKAFADACWPAELFGDSYSQPASCINRTPTIKPTAVK